MSIIRTVTIEPLTPQELAKEFCALFADEQASFFSAISNIAREWPGACWCQQSCAIVEQADGDAIDAIVTLASHLPARHVERIVAGAAS